MATDDRSEQDLRERVAELEAQIKELQGGESRSSGGDITRRQALAGLTGVAGLATWGSSTGASGTASAAGTQEVGQLGEPGRPIDAVAEDIFGPGGQGSGDPVNFEAVNTDKATIGDEANGNRAVLENTRDAAPHEVVLKPESGDTVGSLLLLPSGTDDRSHYLIGNSSDPNNFGGVKWEIDGNIADIESFQKGTGSRPEFLQFREWQELYLNGALTIYHRNLSGSRNQIRKTAVASNRRSEGTRQWVEDISQTAKVIHTGDPDWARGYTVDILIRNGGTNYGMETVKYVVSGGHTVVSSIDRDPIPATNYTVDGNDLMLDVDSSTVNVGVRARGITGQPR